MNDAPDNPSPDAEGFSAHPIEDVARLTGFSRHTLAVFCRHGFVAPVGGVHSPASDAEWAFDDDALQLLQLLARLHRNHGLDLAGLNAVGSLLAELEALRAELRFRRGL